MHGRSGFGPYDNNTEWLAFVRSTLEAGLTVECQHCHAEYVTHSAQSRYCSPRCRMAAHLIEHPRKGAHDEGDTPA